MHEEIEIYGNGAILHLWLAADCASCFWTADFETSSLAVSPSCNFPY
jgi:hypothetical protein